MVLLGHIHLYTYGWNSHSAGLTMPLNILLYMHLGVNIFLVLSGFCLALPVIRNNNLMPQSLTAYFKARAWRILPPYYATLIIILLINCFFPIIAAGRHPLGLTFEIPASVLWANGLLMQDFFPQLNTINGPFWSIATEWHLYFIFPALVLILRRLGALALFIAGSGIALWLTCMKDPVLSGNLGMVVPQPPYFVFLFMLGILTAWFCHAQNYASRLLKTRLIIRITALLTLLGLCSLLWNFRIINGSNVHFFLDHLHWIDPLCGLLGALLLVILSDLPQGHAARRVFELKPLVAIGGYSYSLYLIHIPLLAVLNGWINDFWPNKTFHQAFCCWH